MKKFLFLDYHELESIQGFSRELEQPVKHPGNPLFAPDAPWENGNMQFYGSVVKVGGQPFQMWYTVIHKPWRMFLAYAESDDGLVWRRPLLEIFRHNGEKTNIVLADNPHGTAVIYDAAEPREDWRYKMVAGTDPSGCICAYHSPDGIHWLPVRRFPVIATNPDCPMGFLRAPDGRYVVYHRLYGFGRRVFRSESWDFVYWTGEPRMVLEPDAGDPTQVQFYGLGAAPYGSYELGTLWMFHTDPEEYGRGHSRGYQEAELAYARSGYAWHRAAQGKPFIPHGSPGSWEQGNLQCASAPVYLDEEIRYYYIGTDMSHKRQWELEPQHAGLGMASLRPDRFVALVAGDEPAELLTVSVIFPSPQIQLNASTKEDGWIRVELLDINAQPIPSLTMENCLPIAGDSTSHQVRWHHAQISDTLVGQPVRLRIHACKARLYSISLIEPGEIPLYHHIRGRSALSHQTRLRQRPC